MIDRHETFDEALARLKRGHMMALGSHFISSGERSRESILPGPGADRSKERTDVRNEDATKEISALRFSVTDVVKFAGALLLMAGAWYALNNRTDANYVSLIAKLDAIEAQMVAEARLRDERAETYTNDQRALKQSVELLKIDVGDLKLSMAKAGLYKGGG